MTKIKKRVALLVGTVMMITILQIQAFAATTTTAYSRIYGASRIETSIKISEAGWTSAGTVILAAADQENLVDSLAVAPLAGQENAPILLTNKNSLDPAVKARIVALGAKKVIVIGAVSDAVKQEVAAINGITVEKLKGANRWETTKLINSKLTNVAGTFVVGYNAVADALSVSSFAAKNRYQIILAGADGNIPADQAAVGTNIYLIGGSTLVANIPNAIRLYGEDRYSTNSKIAETLSFDWSKVYEANGISLVDGLTVAPLAAQNSSFVALTSSNDILAKSNVNPKLSANSAVIALGGPTVIPDDVRALIQYTSSSNSYVPVSVTGVSVVDGKDGYTPVATPIVGQVLRANITLSNGTVIGTYLVNINAVYKWHYKDSDTILGTTSSYTVTSDNIGKVICVDVSVNGYTGKATWTAKGSVPATCWTASVALNNNVTATGTGTNLTATLPVTTDTEVQFSSLTTNPFNIALASGAKIPFKLTSTGGVDLDAYYKAAKAGADWTTGWAKYLISTLPGTTDQTAMFYITFDGTNYRIIDGTHDFTGNATEAQKGMSIPANFPAGVYTLAGTVNGTVVTVEFNVTNANGWVVGWNASVALNNITATGTGTNLTATLPVTTDTEVQFSSLTTNPFNVALASGAKIPFKLTSTGGVDLDAYYKATKAGADWTTGWAKYLISTLPGTADQTAMFYITYDGTNYRIIDGTLGSINSAGATSGLGIPASFPAGTYTLAGIVNGTVVTVEFNITNANGWVVGWNASVALNNNVTATGTGTNLAATLPVTTDTEVQFSSLTTNPFNIALTSGAKIPFKLTSTGGVDLDAYYKAAKAGADWTAGWAKYLISTLPGTTDQTAMFYITFDGTNYRIIDGTHDFTGNTTEAQKGMFIPANFPAGTYTLAGTVNGTVVTVEFNITNVLNGGFETGTFEGWLVQSGGIFPIVQGDTAFEGAYASFMSDGAEGLSLDSEPASASIAQYISISDNGLTPYLNLAYLVSGTEEGEGFDYMKVYINGGEIGYWWEDSNGWQTFKYDLSAYKGQNIELKIESWTDDDIITVNYYVDNISISYEAPTLQ